MNIRFFILLFFPLAASAQIEIGEKEAPPVVVSEIKLAGRFIASLEYRTTGLDTTFSLIFQNADYEYAVDLVFVRFSPAGGTLPQLRAILLEACDGGTDYSREIKLGETPVRISGFGSKRVFIYTEDGYTILSRKQVTQLIK